MPCQQTDPGLEPAALVIDLDGTLTPVDTLAESVVRSLRRGPGAAIALLVALFSGRARFKARVAALASVAADQIPWRKDLIDFVDAERRRGRKIILATAADRSIAMSVADHLRLFDEVVATHDGRNLKGEAKLEAILCRVGSNFVYAGDSAADVPIWNAGRAAILVGRAVRFEAALKVPVERVFRDQGNRWKAWLDAVRPHQWAKNALVFVPLLTSFEFGDAARVAAATLAFAAFCLAATATYLLNDVWDIDSDRLHAQKRDRPFASGRLPLHQGLVASVLLFIVAAWVAITVSRPFAILIVGYALLTTLYSWKLKRHSVLDVVTLAVLYSWRVLAGAVAISVIVSPWLLAFSVFIFFSLALVKRCSELVNLRMAGDSAAHGRDYRVGDLDVLWPLGIGAGLSSVVVLGLYIGSPEAAGRYASAELLWLVGLALMYWIARIWIKTGRGEMHEDPVVFALIDRGSRWTIVAIVLLALAAHFIGIR